MKESKKLDIAALRHQTTNTIAFIVLIVFCLFLLIILIKSTLACDAENANCNEPWLALFKDGFLLLGGALTTLIGYYFGSKGSDQALMTAEQLKEKAEKIANELVQQAPTTDESAPDINPL